MGTDGEGDGGEAKKQASYKNPNVERFLGWWRTPSDRFAGLIAAFTLCLFVATCGLWRATTDLVEDAKASGRAWLGPINAGIDPLADGKPLKIVIAYNNTGKEPAQASWFVLPIIYPKEKWNDGTAFKEVGINRDNCLKYSRLDGVLNLAFPTSGFTSYQLTYDASIKPEPPTEHDPKLLTADAPMLAGDNIVVLMACMTYRTLGAIHHTSFCYWYRNKVIPPNNLAFCTNGQGAD